MKEGGLAFTHTYSWGDLSSEEQAVLDTACALIQMTDVASKGYDVLSHVKVVDFADDRVRGTFRSDTQSICLSKSLVGNLQDTLEVMIHEVAHTAGGDGEVEHERRQVNLAVQALVALMS